MGREIDLDWRETQKEGHIRAEGGGEGKQKSDEKSNGEAGRFKR